MLSVYSDEQRIKHFEFHEIDTKGNRIAAGLTALEYHLFKTQLQVMDNYFDQLDSTTSRIEE